MLTRIGRWIRRSLEAVTSDVGHTGGQRAKDRFAPCTAWQPVIEGKSARIAGDLPLKIAPLPNLKSRA
jgi:hypothetical protein